MPQPIPVSIGNANLNLKFTNEAVADALFELQGHVPAGLLGGLKLSLEQALPLLERGDHHAIEIFLKHGAKWQRRNLTDPQIFGWLDEFMDPEGNDGSLNELNDPIQRALSAAGQIVREKKTTNPDGTVRVERERPHLTTVSGA